MDIKITSLNSKKFLTLGNESVEISEYKIKSSVKENELTELEIKIILNNEDKVTIIESHS